ncbi:hypothetical protein [Xylella taiwanensis]|uniref:Uncharacterized protein n=1 Tax=Xylella taiwanensis TaxID=1444770 RepID=Z9JEY5_9GAMM|nr:hypothetical protein [Xylella taiwanensis]EWS76950.1 hypothetical protein AF72_13415 [Xylella taiwanensis]MCD8455848.1 hypothetical protein [Xylella taiwanensis]MCD8460390.1 hypothetical protein [Xylella taiwanensis]MCD8463552.1 hypothetical protein [Xylella taiwanensis]MCD8464891.1 hypothetical protein [Xylella taiwanensis]
MEQAKRLHQYAMSTVQVFVFNLLITSKHAKLLDPAKRVMNHSFGMRWLR